MYAFHAGVLRIAVDLRRLSRTVGVIVLVLLLGVAGFGVYRYYVAHHAEVSLSQDAAVARVYRRVGPDEPVTLTLAAYPRRSFLRLTPHLYNPGILGDCVDPATIEVVPVFQGRPSPRTFTLRNGQPAQIAVPDWASRIGLTVTVRQPDRQCEVELTFTHVTLHN